MEVKTAKKPVFDPGLCRCCGTMKKCRLLNFEYENAGRKEIYSEMIMDCFGILLSLSGKPSERLVCATCVLRLRDALDFRRQVLRCEEAFLLMKMYDTEFADRQQPIAEATVQGAPLIEIEVVKTEPTEEDEESNGVDMCQDALADGPPSPDDADIKPKLQDSDTDDLPLSQHVNIMKSSSKLPKLIGKREVEQQTGDGEDRVEKKKERRDVKTKRLANMKPMTRASVISKMISKKHKVPMSQVQQLMRERDPAYMTETNILTIVEYSYVCPFKCRHNHLICYYCGEHFNDPTLLREHTLKTHHPKKFKVTEHKNMIKVDLTRIDCRLCATKIDDLEDFKRHISSVHKKKYYFEYKDSVLPFKLTKEELKCALCDVLFPYFHALNKHMNEHFSNYVCETCGLGFVDKGRFVMHQQRHEVGDFPCETCGKIFKAEYNRDLHIDRVHNKRGRVYCPKCDVRLMSYPQKLKHLVEAHGEQPLSFSCSLCAKVCDTRRTLTIHWRKEHLKDFRYECKCCGQKFFTRFALTNHMPTHTGERNFKCKVCEKSYPRLKTLKDHMRIHTNDRRYRCHVCGQAFIQNCSLKGHMKSQHPEYG